MEKVSASVNTHYTPVPVPARPVIVNNFYGTQPQDSARFRKKQKKHPIRKLITGLLASVGLVTTLAGAGIAVIVLLVSKGKINIAKNGGLENSLVRKFLATKLGIRVIGYVAKAVKDWLAKDVKPINLVTEKLTMKITDKIIPDSVDEMIQGLLAKLKLIKKSDAEVVENLTEITPKETGGKGGLQKIRNIFGGKKPH